MKTRIGVASHPDTPYDELVSAAAAADVDFVEVMMEGPGERRRLAERADRFVDTVPQRMDVLVHLPFGGVDVGAPIEHVRDGSLRELEAGIDLAADLGATKAVYHADTFVRPEIWAEDRVRSNVFEAVDALHEYGRRCSVEVCVENVPGPFVSIEEFPLLFDRTEAPVTIDTGHARVTGMDDATLAEFLADHAARISHLHLNDARGPRDEHLPVGMGNADFGAILGALPPEWEGTLTVEALTADFAFVETGIRRLRAILP